MHLLTNHQHLSIKVCLDNHTPSSCEITERRTGYGRFLNMQWELGRGRKTKKRCGGGGWTTLKIISARFVTLSDGLQYRLTSFSEAAIPIVYRLTLSGEASI